MPSGKTTPLITNSLVLAEKLTWDHYQIVKEQVPSQSPGLLLAPNWDLVFYRLSYPRQAPPENNFRIIPASLFPRKKRSRRVRKSPRLPKP